MADVIILAGGLGSRLQGVLGNTPKCMAPIAGKPFLDYQLDYLQKEGFNHVIVSVGYLKEHIISHFQVHSKKYSVQFSIEDEPLGTGGAIMKALDLCETNKVLVLNGDTFFPVDINRMIEIQITKDADAIIAMREVPDAGRYGRIQSNLDGRITSFSEKDSSMEPGLINGGIYLFKRDLIEKSGFTGRFSLEHDLLPLSCQTKKVYGVLYNDYFIDIGIPEDLEKARKEIPKNE